MADVTCRSLKMVRRGDAEQIARQKYYCTARSVPLPSYISAAANECTGRSESTEPEGSSPGLGDLLVPREPLPNGAVSISFHESPQILELI